MPAHERVLTAWKSYIGAAERVATGWKNIVAGWEYDGSAWKLIYQALGPVRNFSITRSTQTTSGYYSSWSSWSSAGSVSGSASGLLADAASINALANSRAIAKVPANTATAQYRIQSGSGNFNSRNNGDGTITVTLTWAFERRTRSYISGTTRTIYTASWAAPVTGDFTRFRIQVSGGSDIVLASNILSRSFGTSNPSVRIRAENETTGINGPWSPWTRYT